MSVAAPLLTANRLIGAELLGLVGQIAERAGPGPLLGLLLDHPVDQGHHRLDGEQGSEQGPGPTDAAALFEVLQGVDDAEHLGAGDEVLRPGRPAGRGRPRRRRVRRSSSTMRPRPMVSEPGVDRPARGSGRPSPWPRSSPTW